MKYEKIKDFQEKQFRRITGVKRSTFDKMVEIISAAEKIKKARGGRPNNLSVEDRVLMTLEYLREYRTYAHIAASYGLSESNTFESIRWVEDTLIKSKEVMTHPQSGWLNECEQPQGLPRLVGSNFSC